MLLQTSDQKKVFLCFRDLAKNSAVTINAIDASEWRLGLARPPRQALRGVAVCSSVAEQVRNTAAGSRHRFHSSAERTIRCFADYPQARPTFRPFSRTPEVPVRRDHLVWTDIQRVLQESPSGYLNPAHRNYLPSESVETLQDLIEFDEDFNVSMTRVRKVYDLYYIRYSSPYDTYFHPTTWTVVIQIFVEVLHLPSPHPGDAEFIEPQPEWFTLPAHSSDRSSDNGSNSTLTPSYIDRAMSEFSEDVPRMMPSRRMLATDGSEAGSSNFGSAPRRGSEYSASERSVSEYTENAPTTTYSRTVREERSSRQFGGNRWGWVRGRMIPAIT